MARLLMAIVIVFLSCHSTKIIVNFYEALQVTAPLYSDLRNLVLDGQVWEAVRAPRVDHVAGEGQPLATHHQLRHQHCHLLL